MSTPSLTPPHSPEAKAAYPFNNPVTPRERSAYDRGRAEAQKAYLAATREAIIKAMRVVTDGEMLGASEQYIRNVTGAVADAILASGIIRDERVVKAEALAAMADEFDPLWSADQIAVLRHFATEYRAEADQPAQRDAAKKSAPMEEALALIPSRFKEGTEFMYELSEEGAALLALAKLLRKEADRG